MRKTFYILILCLALGATQSVQAQSLEELLKGLSSLLGSSEQEPAKPKISHPEVYDLIGRWAFDGLVMDYTGDSSLASVAVSTLETQLPTLATKFGLVAGRDYIEIGDDGSVTFVSGDNRLPAQCTYYDSYSGEATLQFYYDGKSIEAVATIIEQDGKTKVLFNANRLMALLSQHYSKFKENTTLQMAKSVIDSYPGIRIGAAVKKR